jgi:uncharacterized protein with HEPN domain
MLDAAARIAGYVDGMVFEEFARDRRTVDAVVRNLEVIGEAARAVASPCGMRLPPYRSRRWRVCEMSSSTDTTASMTSLSGMPR